MAKKAYDVVAVTGSYTDRNGVEKRRYVNCGAVFETDKGMSLKLETIPVGFDGWFQLYEPKDQQQGQRRHDEQKRNGYQNDESGDVPF